jgi:hypothetical protein
LGFIRRCNFKLNTTTTGRKKKKKNITKKKRNSITIDRVNLMGEWHGPWKLACSHTTHEGFRRKIKIKKGEIVVSYLSIVQTIIIYPSR